ncbi:glycosyltransferase involved in cell wall biosynthesis [Acetoanaerobium pronyense]|uniref:Glycosyltransferase involved in cell wall biosynthesis n=1 Tax=Acetoanaerobium pronyense TaxID=1482736 RepID=A0ABS4KH96_9FIRM|nr:glycosyltransferase [Acetoanaerobium pronyense]MBP2027140.1 glycosyltransferase involved in cell wall biosynthesis [Acetoanaerobium pronyense]
MNKIKIFSLLPSIMPSTVLSILKPLLELQRKNILTLTIGFTFFKNPKQIKKNDIVVLCRNCELNDYRIIFESLQYKNKLIFDIDDNFYDISIDTEIGKYHRNPIRLFFLDSIIAKADFVRVYSKPLFEKISQKNSNISLKNAYFDFSLIKELQRENNDKIRITYATSRGSQDEMYKEFEKAIIKILEEYPNKVEFYIWGFKPERLIKYENCFFMPTVKNYDAYIKTFYKKNFDIGLAPLKDDLFHNSKTNNKYREYGGMGVAGIYSQTELYRECINNGKNGLLVFNNYNSWYSAIKRLINDNNLLNSIKVNAQQDVLKNYSFDSFVLEWEKDIKNVYNSTFKNENSTNILKHKILILHSKNTYSYERRDVLLYLLQNLGIAYKVEYIENFLDGKVLDKNQFNVFFVFTDISPEVDKFIEEIDMDKVIIFDSQIPIPIKKQDNIYYIFPHHTPEVNDLNVFCIPTIDMDRNIIKNKILETYKEFKDLWSQKEIIDFFQTFTEKERKYEETFYSRKSPVYLYAFFLSKIKIPKQYKDMKAISRYTKIIFKKSRFLRSIKAFIEKLIKKTLYTLVRIKVILFYLKTIICVNIFKIYK